MELNLEEELKSIKSVSMSGICSVCHQPVSPQYYFCPNCGNKLNSAPVVLSTNTNAQVKLYAISIIMPMVCFLLYKKWDGIKYYKSNDPETKKIGQIAFALIVISTILTVWYGIVFTQKSIKAMTESINASITQDFGI